MGKKEKKERKSVRETAMFLGTGMRFKLLFYNAIPLIIVEGVYTVASVLIIAPLFRIAFKLLAIISGIETITSENFLGFLTRPLPLLCLLALIICIGIYSLLDISAAIFTFDCSRQHKKITVIEILEFSVKNAVRCVRPKNLLILPVVLIMLPIIGFGVSSSFTSSFELPIFVIDFLRNSRWLALIGIVAIIVMLVITLRWIFSIHYFTIERVDYLTAIKKSAQLDRRHRILNFISMLFVQIVLLAINAVLVFIGKRIALLVIATFGVTTVCGACLLAIVFVLFGLAIVVLAVLSIPISVLRISAKYYYLKEQAGEDLIPVQYEQRPLPNTVRKISRILPYALLVASVVVSAILFYVFSNENIDLLSTVKGDTAITGYRGGGSTASDGNTLSSISNAAQYGVDGVSVDAQISQDGQVFLAASPNLSAISTQTGYAQDMNYQDIIDGQETGNANANFPLLSSAIDTAQAEQIRIVIDISAIEYCNDGVDKVTQVVTESGYADKCEIASRHYRDIERIRALDPTIKTIYIAGIAFGAFSSFPCADCIALESIAISDDSIEALHVQNKEAYAWCVSSSETCVDAITNKADNMVATNVYVAQKALVNLGLSDFGYSVLSSLSTEEK